MPAFFMFACLSFHVCLPFIRWSWLALPVCVRVVLPLGVLGDAVACYGPGTYSPHTCNKKGRVNLD